MDTSLGPSDAGSKTSKRPPFNCFIDDDDDDAAAVGVLLLIVVVLL